MVERASVRKNPTRILNLPYFHMKVDNSWKQKSCINFLSTQRRGRSLQILIVGSN